MRSDSQETVDELLNVAERLFAEHGVEHVPLTRIVASSSQKNRSALHYHFGSRDGVLAAVLSRRLGHINELRHTMLDGSAGSAHVLWDTVYALATPLGHVALHEPWGADYLSVLAQVRFHPRLLGQSALDDTNLSALRRCKRLIEHALPEIPGEILSWRLRWLTDSVVSVIARWTLETPRASRARTDMGDVIDHLVAYGAAALAAPAPISRGKMQSSIVRTLLAKDRG